MKYTASQITRLDKLARELVLARGRCERCQETYWLQWAHIVTRGRKNTRWDLDAALCLCQPCHALLDANRKTLLRDFAIAKMGEDAYWALVARSRDKPQRSVSEIVDALRYPV